MVFKAFSAPFGGMTRSRILTLLALVKSSYPREMTRLLDVNLNAVRKALIGLELDGLVVGRTIGRTRLFELNPRYFARQELLAYLDRLAEADADLQARTAQLRRRPRRTGKPL